MKAIIYTGSLDDILHRVLYVYSPFKIVYTSYGLTFNTNAFGEFDESYMVVHESAAKELVQGLSFKDVLFWDGAGKFNNSLVEYCKSRVRA